MFVVSWVNPDETLADKSFEDYMREGLLAALDAIEEATGEREVNVIGYCLGGTLLAATLAYMAVKGDDRVRLGDLLHHAWSTSPRPASSRSSSTRSSSRALEERMNEKGYLDGARRWRRPSTCCAPTT